MNMSVKLRNILFLSACIMALSFVISVKATASSSDVVIRYDAEPVKGRILNETWKSVQIRIHVGGAAAETEILSGDIKDIQYGDMPPEYALALSSMRRGHYEEAIAQIRSVKADADVRVSWYASHKAFHLAESLYLAGKTEDAREALEDFVREHSLSRLFPRALYRLGRIEAELKNYRRAKGRFEELAEKNYGTAWKFKGQLGIARLLDEQGEFESASNAYNNLLNELEGVEPRSSSLNGIINEVRIAVASVMVRRKEFDRAFDFVKTLMNDSEEMREDDQSMARAYSILGDCSAALDKLEEARYYYLHTYVLYPMATKEARRALCRVYEISFELWEKSKNDTERQRATEYQEILKEEYPDASCIRGL